MPLTPQEPSSAYHFFQSKPQDTPYLQSQSIWSITENVLNQLKQKALSRAIHHDVEAFYLGETEEEARMYPIVRKVGITYLESGLTKGHFYALSQLIDLSVRSCREKYAHELEFFVIQGPDEVVIHAKHAPLVINLAFAEEKKLVAPVAQLPFDGFLQGLAQAKNLLEANWQPAPLKPGFLVLESLSSLRENHLMSAIERAGQELDSTLDLERERERKDIYIKEDGFKKLKTLLFNPIENNLENSFSSSP